MSNRALQIAAFIDGHGDIGRGQPVLIPAFTEQKSVVALPAARSRLSAGAEEVYKTLFRAARFVCSDSIKRSN